MFIQTEGTPNPATLKFLPGCDVMNATGQGGANFTGAEMATRSPLALRLFELDGVNGVYLGGDFITITKTDAKEWETMKPLVLGVIMEHFTAGKPVIENSSADDDDDDDAADGSIEGQIKELLDTRVRPAVAQDGGDIVFHSFEDGVVYLTMQGACSGCPSSSATLKHGIENMLRHYIPEVTEVRASE
ncbi:MAG: NifU family protein [Rhodospirillaceae bacterium]|jgi:Fe-S cluster biogenesis protein NfuA|nr:NifU family protein [Rhodospirillaceae bacterium]MBT5243047.1 NifU family protein [Rhodospirillaceae bacterium]MBT5563272.1 NifU family protein [Rhodospirillaceae bacterium]MBT6243586.1 NifU family protein [Rhodospirillaceae bacterium]MBT7136482.1 NifU family protein [Rhodospirillaceae bacterium]